MAKTAKPIHTTRPEKSKIQGGAELPSSIVIMPKVPTINTPKAKGAKE